MLETKRELPGFKEKHVGICDDSMEYLVDKLLNFQLAMGSMSATRLIVQLMHWSELVIDRGEALSTPEHCSNEEGSHWICTTTKKIREEKTIKYWNVAALSPPNVLEKAARQWSVLDLKLEEDRKSGHIISESSVQ